MRQGLLVAVTAVVATLLSSPAFAQDKAAEKGMKLFAEQKCSACHSVAGKGNVKGPLDEAVAKLSADDVRQWLVNPDAMREKSGAERKPAMKSFSSLSKGDLDALVAYVMSLKKK